MEQAMSQTQYGAHFNFDYIQKSDFQIFCIEIGYIKYTCLNLICEVQEQMPEVLNAISKGDIYKILENKFEFSINLKIIKKIVQRWMGQKIMDFEKYGEDIHFQKLLEDLQKKIKQEKKISKLMINEFVLLEININTIIEYIENIQKIVCDFLQEIQNSDILLNLMQIDLKKNENQLEKGSAIFNFLLFLTMCFEESQKMLEFEYESIEYKQSISLSSFCIQNTDFEDNFEDFEGSKCMIFGNKLLAMNVQQIIFENHNFYEKFEDKFCQSIKLRKELQNDNEEKLMKKILDDVYVEQDSIIFNDNNYLSEIFEKIISISIKMSKFNLSLTDTIGKIEVVIKYNGLNSQFHHYENLLKLLADVFQELWTLQIDKLVDLFDNEGKLKSFEILLSDLKFAFIQIRNYQGNRYSQKQLDEAYDIVNEIQNEIERMNSLISQLKELMIDENGSKMVDSNNKEFENLADFEIFLLEQKYSDKSVIVALLCILKYLSQMINNHEFVEGFSLSSFQNQFFEKFGKMLASHEKFPDLFENAEDIFKQKGLSDYQNVIGNLEEEIKNKIDNFKNQCPSNESDNEQEEQEIDED